jgi:phosphoribosylformylglycinamidine synthase
MTDNLNFGRPTNPDSFHALAKAVQGLAEACNHFDVPVTGGNVSLNNESPAGVIDPTPVVAILGIVAKPEHVTRSQVRAVGQRLVLLGGWPDELGASEYLSAVHGVQAGAPPAAEFEPASRLHGLLLAQIEDGRVRAAHDVSEGGLLVCVAEMLFAPEATHGASLRLDAPGVRRDALLFGESQSRAVVAVEPADVPAVLAAAVAAGVPAVELGTVDASGLLRVEAGGLAGSWEAAALRASWETSIERTMARPGLDGASP